MWEMARPVKPTVLILVDHGTDLEEVQQVSVGSTTVASELGVDAGERGGRDDPRIIVGIFGGRLHNTHATTMSLTKAVPPP